MNRRCPSCNLVNFAEVAVCKRCGTSLDASPAAAASTLPAAAPAQVAAHAAAARAPEFASNYRPPTPPAGPLIISDDGIIARHVARMNRNMQWTNALILLAVIGVALLNTKYLYHLATGAKHVDQKTLFRIKSAGGKWGGHSGG